MRSFRTGFFYSRQLPSGRSWPRQHQWMRPGKDCLAALHRQAHRLVLLRNRLVAETNGLPVALQRVSHGNNIVRGDADVSDLGMPLVRLPGEGGKQILADLSLVGDDPGDGGSGAEHGGDMALEAGAEKHTEKKGQAGRQTWRQGRSE